MIQSDSLYPAWPNDRDPDIADPGYLIPQFIPKRPADALQADASMARTAQLVAIFAQLGDYGQRVTLAQMAAMLRVQSGK